jgi:hypothetical protein
MNRIPHHVKDDFVSTIDKFTERHNLLATPGDN